MFLHSDEMYLLVPRCSQPLYVPPKSKKNEKKTLKLSHRVTYERCFAELRKCECAGNLLFAKVFLFAQM